MIDDWYMDLHSIQSGKELADNTKNNILAAGNKIFEQAVRDNLIQHFPLYIGIYGGVCLHRKYCSRSCLKRLPGTG